MSTRSLYLAVLVFLFTGCGNKVTEKNHIKIGCRYLEFARGDAKSKLDFDFSCFYSSYDLFSDSLAIHYYYDQGTILALNLESGTRKLIRVDKTIAQKCGFSYANVYQVNGVFYVANANGGIYRLNDSVPVLKANINSDPRMKKRMLMMNQALGFNRDFTFLNQSELIFQCIPNLQGFERRLQNYPLFAKLNLETQEIDFFNYSFRKELLEKIRPLQEDIYQTVSQGHLLVSYMFSPVVDVISLKTRKKAGVLTLRSAYQDEDIPFLEEGYTDFEKERFGIEAAHYGPIVYNHYKNCYYRIFYRQLPERNEEGDFTIPADRKVSIAIFDGRGKWIGEVNIKNAFAGAITPTKGGFLLNVNEVKVENNTIRFKEYIHG